MAAVKTYFLTKLELLRVIIPLFLVSIAEDTIMKMTYFMLLNMLSSNQADTQLYLLLFSKEMQETRWPPKKLTFEQVRL